MEKISIVSIRFNNDTWNENMLFKNRFDFHGCIYGSQQQMTSSIEPYSLIFVIEMNNSTNQILGIGLIRNITKLDKYFKIYGDGNYNRYIYKGKYRIDREKIIQYNEVLVMYIEEILFKGKSHSKRGAGFTKVPDKLLQHKKYNGFNFIEEIKKIFVSCFVEIY